MFREGLKISVPKGFKLKSTLKRFKMALPIAVSIFIVMYLIELRFAINSMKRKQLDTIRSSKVNELKKAYEKSCQKNTYQFKEDTSSLFFEFS